MHTIAQLAGVEHLNPSDFTVFRHDFVRVLADNLPPCDTIVFTTGEKSQEKETSKKVAEELNTLFANTTSVPHCVSVGSTMLLAIATNSGWAAAIIDGVDGYITRRATQDWLVEKANICQQALLRVKRNSVDPDTDLPHRLKFLDDLEECEKNGAVSLLLIESSPRAASSVEAARHAGKCSRIVKMVVGEKAPVYSLGYHLFALLLAGPGGKRLKNLGAQIVGSFRREGVKRIHVGMDLASAGREPADQTLRIIDRAWSALQGAKRKGPHAWCDYDHLVHPDNHPLRPPSNALAAKFQRMWKKSAKFSIVAVSCADDEEFTEAVSVFGKNFCLVENKEMFLFKDRVAPEKALEMVVSELQRHRIDGFTAGVASYPYLDFSKRATIINSRKALLHAGFFGRGGTAVFDGVSLNISGDVYYTEGDLRSAIKDYKKGLACNPADTNLHNSLGVAYVDINAPHLARGCFEAALKLNPDDFLALYNSGLGAESEGRYDDAISYYERAREQVTEFDDAKEDIKLHLGRLYCETGRFEESAALLVEWQRSREKNTKLQGQTYTALGKAYFGMGELKKAEESLHKALRYDEFDGVAMGLLGHIYLICDEGRDIAMSLCRRSVELEPNNSWLRLYLATVQISAGLCKEARQTLRKCRQKGNILWEVQLTMCESYLQEGNYTRALHWCNKLLAQDIGDEKLRQRGNSLLHTLRKGNEERKKKNNTRTEIQP